MKLFTRNELKEALEFSLRGGQALQVYDSNKIPFGLRAGKSVPGVFLRYREWAHLFDRNKRRLKKTAKSIGIKRIVIDRKGTRKQHVDICGAPLRNAKLLCETEIEPRKSE